MRIICVTLLLATFLIGCKRKLKTDFKNLKNFEFAGLVIPLPGIYAETNVDFLIEAWRYSENPAEIVETRIKQLESLRLKEGSFTVFADTTDVGNTVLIFTGPYLKIGKWTSQQLFLTLEKKLRAEAKYLGVEFKPIENSYYSLRNGNDILKIKFEWNSNSKKSYGTEYLLSTNGLTFGIMVTNHDDDFEGLIRTAKFTFD